MNPQEKKELLQAQMDNSLLLACEKQDIKVLKELISQGANPKTCSHQAIIWACYNKSWDTAQELLKHYKPKELGNLKSIIKTRLGDNCNNELKKEIDSIFSKKIIESMAKTEKTLEF